MTTAEKQTADGGRTAVYVYGILPGNIELEAGTAGVGDPPGEVRLVRHRNLSALVSDVDRDKPLGRAEDLLAHEELLDASAADVPVLPLRFGAVMASDEAVEQELLSPHYDEFANALEQIDGFTEYVVRGRYVEEALLGDVLAQNPEAEELRQQINQGDPDATRDERIQLGMIVSNAIEVSRQADTEALGNAVADLVSASVVREPTHELDAVYVALLLETAQTQALEEAIAGLADEWRGRVELRLIGPLAAYDFVQASPPAADSVAETEPEPS